MAQRDESDRIRVASGEAPTPNLAQLLINPSCITFNRNGRSS